MAKLIGHMRRPALALGLFVCTVAAATSAELATSPPDPSHLTPEKMYLRAIHAMREIPQPPYVTFRETIIGRNFAFNCTADGASLTLHHGDVTAAYDVSFRTSDGSAVSSPVGDANAKPCPSALLMPAGKDISALGLPQPAPSALPQSTTATDAGMGTPIIASVRVEGARYYHIDLVGRERLGPNDVYHLKLRAYREPNTHPLTDLYIDPESYLEREARGEVSGHYVLARGRVAGIIDFDRVGAYWLVAREQFEIAANALLVHARMSATIAGSNFATPSDLPNAATAVASSRPCVVSANSSRAR